MWCVIAFGESKRISLVQLPFFPILQNFHFFLEFCIRVTLRTELRFCALARTLVASALADFVKLTLDYRTLGFLEFVKFLAIESLNRPGTRRPRRLESISKISKRYRIISKRDFPLVWALEWKSAERNPCEAESRDKKSTKRIG